MRVSVKSQGSEVLRIIYRSNPRPAFWRQATPSGCSTPPTCRRSAKEWKWTCRSTRRSDRDVSSLFFFFFLKNIFFFFFFFFFFFN